jgi:ribosomal protein L18
VGKDIRQGEEERKEEMMSTKKVGQKTTAERRRDSRGRREGFGDHNAPDLLLNKSNSAVILQLHYGTRRDILKYWR